MSGASVSQSLRRGRTRAQDFPRLLLAVALLTLVAGGCRDLQDPTVPDFGVDPGFLAVVTNVTGDPRLSPGTDWRMRIFEVSGTFPVNEQKVFQPGDTLIFSLPPATYQLEISGNPPACNSRFGLARRGTVFDPGTTTVVRYNVACAPLLSILTGTDGFQVDSTFVYRVSTPSGQEVGLGTMSPNDTILFDDMPEGPYVTELEELASNCHILNSGRRRQEVQVAPPASPLVRYRITCADPRYAPEVLGFGATHQDGATSLYLRVADAGSSVTGFPDLNRFVLDVTDCSGNSLYSNGPREFRGLRAPGSRIIGQDTAAILFSLPGALPGPPALGPGVRCAEVRVVDQEGNTTGFVVDDLLDDGFGRPPSVRDLRILELDPLTDPKLRFEFDVSDPDGDLAGVFVTYTVVDGTLASQDGFPEIWIPNVLGWAGALVPDQRTAAFPFTLDDLEAVTLYFIDRAGNVYREVVEDIVRAR